MKSIQNIRQLSCRVRLPQHSISASRTDSLFLFAGIDKSDDEGFVLIVPLNFLQEHHHLCFWQSGRDEQEIGLQRF